MSTCLQAAGSRLETPGSKQQAARRIAWKSALEYRMLRRGWWSRDGGKVEPNGKRKSYKLRMRIPGQTLVGWGFRDPEAWAGKR